jgi:lysophospholipase L1-like esterase
VNLENFELSKKANSVNPEIQNKLSLDSNGKILIEGQPIQGGGETNIDDINKSDSTTYSSNKIDNTYIKQEIGKSLIDNTKITKLDNISSGANKIEKSNTNGNIKIDGVETNIFTQIQSDWNETDNTKIDYIKNKPTDLIKATNIKQGTNITLTINGNDITIDASKDIEFVDILPSSNISSDKIYILKNNFSLNIYDGSTWIIANSLTTEQKAKIDIINANGDGNSFLSNDGTYKITTFNVNKSISVNISDWAFDNLTNTYKTTITHNLNTKDIFINMFDKDEQINLLGIIRIDNNSIQIENDSAIDGEIIINYSTNTIDTRWSGTTLNCLGDSITYGYLTTKTFHEYLKQMMILNTVNNYGIIGSKIASSDADSMNMRYGSMDANADIVLVFGGTNDYNYSIPLGTNTDTTNTTFYGALKILIEGLINKYPTKCIVFLTPLQRNYNSTGGMGANSAGFTLLQYVDAIKEMCGKYSIPVFDLYRNLGISTLNLFNFTTDGLHPDANGHKRIAYKIASFLNNQ